MKVTMTIKRAIENYPCLQALAKARTIKQRQKILANSPGCIYAIIIDIAKQILNGTIPVKKKSQLKRYKNAIRKLTEKIPVHKKKKIINQKGGFLPLLIKPALTILASLVANKLMKK